MPRRFAFRPAVAVPLVALLLLAAVPVASGADSVATTAATVVGTDAARVLACPRPSCRERAKVPLGGSVTVAGEAVDGFFPVRAGGRRGFVYKTFLYRPDAVDGVPRLDQGSPGCDRVALIFNIGAGYEPATGILDTLRREDVPATMFVMGWWAERNGPLLERLIADGFPIGSHGNLPPELTLRADDDIAADLRAAAAAIEAASGAPPGPWFTPFAAAIDDRVRAVAVEQGYLPIGWTVPSEDWSPEATADAVYARVVDNVQDGAIVELHLDASTSAASTAVALPRIIAELRGRGFRFVTIPEMAEPCA